MTNKDHFTLTDKGGTLGPALWKFTVKGSLATVFKTVQKHAHSLELHQLMQFLAQKDLIQKVEITKDGQFNNGWGDNPGDIPAIVEYTPETTRLIWYEKGQIKNPEAFLPANGLYDRETKMLISAQDETGKDWDEKQVQQFNKDLLQDMADHLPYDDVHFELS